MGVDSVFATPEDQKLQKKKMEVQLFPLTLISIAGIIGEFPFLKAL